MNVFMPAMQISYVPWMYNQVGEGVTLSGVTDHFPGGGGAREGHDQAPRRVRGDDHQSGQRGHTGRRADKQVYSVHSILFKVTIHPGPSGGLTPMTRWLWVLMTSSSWVTRCWQPQCWRRAQSPGTCISPPESGGTATTWRPSPSLDQPGSGTTKLPCLCCHTL